MIAVEHVMPERPVCEVCQQTRQFRRGLCRSCWRKWRDANIDMKPPKRGGWPANRLLDLVVRAVAKFTPAERTQVRAACDEQPATDGEAA